MRDNEVIAAANARGIAMVVTGMRHFRHSKNSGSNPLPRQLVSLILHGRFRLHGTIKHPWRRSSTVGDDYLLDFMA